MADDDTLFGVRIGPDPSEARAINHARQKALPAEDRAQDPSALGRAVDRRRRLDELARARNEFRTGGANG